MLFIENISKEGRALLWAEGNKNTQNPQAYPKVYFRLFMKYTKNSLKAKADVHKDLTAVFFKLFPKAYNVPTHAVIMTFPPIPYALVQNL